MSEYKPGAKVLIIEDCREGGQATGLVGVYEGEFPRSVIVVLVEKMIEYDYDGFINGDVRFKTDGGVLGGKPAVHYIPYYTVDGRHKHPLGGEYPAKPDDATPFWFETNNPRIRLPDGSAIWGDECMWGDAVTAPPLAEAKESLD